MTRAALLLALFALAGCRVSCSVESHPSAPDLGETFIRMPGVDRHATFEDLK